MMGTGKIFLVLFMATYTSLTMGAAVVALKLLIEAQLVAGITILFISGAMTAAGIVASAVMVAEGV